jgi:hypothetical protein
MVIPPLILALGRMRQKNGKFEVRLSYRVPGNLVQHSKILAKKKECEEVSV